MPPKTVPSCLGPVPVVLKRDLSSSAGDRCLGLWDCASRTIYLEADQSKTSRQVALYHERIESILYDSGLTNLIKPKQREAICDCLAMALVRKVI